MQFVYPSFLWALLALAIPIIIHLFYFRRFKKVYFTNVRFLKEIKEETTSRNKLKKLLVLLCRMLALAFLVFAFAQPFLPRDADVKMGTKAVSIFVDNSFSMNAMSKDVTLLEKAKQYAKGIVEAYSEEDRFQILTNDFEGKHQRMVSKEDALQWIEDIKSTPTVRSLSKVCARQQQALTTSALDNKSIYILSDFQKNINDLTTQQDSTVEINLVPLSSVQQQNISIDSAWFEAPVQMLNQSNRLMVKVHNWGDQAAEGIPLNLKQYDQVKPVGLLNIPAQSSAVDTVNVSILKTGWQGAELSITDFPIQFDDSYHFSLNVSDRVNILVLNENTSNRYLDALFQSVPYFQTQNQTSRNLDYSKLPQFQLIVLNGLKNITTGMASELGNYIKNGGNVLFFPDAQGSVESYNTFLGNLGASTLGSLENSPREVGSMNNEAFVFQDVFEKSKSDLKLPSTQSNFHINSSGNSEEILLSYRDGKRFLSKFRAEQGHIYLCAAPLDDTKSDLVKQGEIFVPMVYKMAISTAQERKIAYIIGRDEVLETKHKAVGSETVYKLKGKQEEFIPEQKNLGAKTLLGLNNQIKEAGFYDLFLQANEVLEKFAYNYDRRESDLTYFDEAALREKYGDHFKIINSNAEADFSHLIGEHNKGITFWKTCLILALAFLLLEILLLRFWKA